ncbi:hypothetical protein Verru16b_02426 [Lacunisphaera limnophila]|uniref:DNA repair protein RecO n=1 Tax=Lacunisphaera limnophila TaxID=1838286 RepID=A0A1D8AWS3_9BACT|nr:hypothetical protein [Lacunisphaera limnophila]AOS45345.1 hypothetical protein Verru16b_02426 [Lacunisphaera limnophila]
MPGPQLQTTAFILARQPSGSDNFEQLTAFSAEHGVLLCLTRLPKTAKPASARRTSAAPNEGRLDLFDEAELWLESSSQGRTWFIKEHRLILRHDGIGRSYEALKTAAAFGTLLARNPVAEESRAPVAALLRSSLGALAAGGRPDIVWLKTLYCLLRDEGYPVKQQWWPLLPAGDRNTAAQLLNQPLAAQTADAPTVTALTRRLEAWVAAETEIRL